MITHKQTGVCLFKIRFLCPFIGMKSNAAPAGHYLLKTKKGWMNPWINYPQIKPAKAGFQQKIPGKIQWIIFEDKRHYI